MTEEIWTILSEALWAMENNDNTMSGNPTARAQIARDWLSENLWDDE